MTLSITVSNVIMQNVIMLSFAFKKKIAERRSAECRYAECRGALSSHQPLRPDGYLQNFLQISYDQS
jgi:hypothetical protein